ncbi:DUF1599 domain-containing protein [Desulfobacca acetoxidans]|uniref:Nucleotide modification associated domain-containing protein n=1 Tax=Desulfobacca acetoxidans (strain ATCC 700848 / DSM 11109 / ASRB2) TaxID=880072 RepID=F2NG09_DESAR|nr:DUF1599 domain-containing protein [Desulfobacca acetoxidans]AEB08422.1 hypothetical protein Desac_0536 [Desulfobacca acetoxidans DSM 11109]
MTFEMVLKQMQAVHEAKNADYGNSFELAADLLGRPVVEVLLSRMIDKVSRAANLVRSGQAAVADESLADTLLDLANYSVLAMLALRDRGAVEYSR